VSGFDDDLDDWEDQYRVYVLPADVELAGSWVDLELKAVRFLGRVPVETVRFDPRRRSQIDLTSLGLDIPVSRR
jgi:hypothetical protein